MCWVKPGKGRRRILILRRYCSTAAAGRELLPIILQLKDWGQRVKQIRGGDAGNGPFDAQ